LGFGNDGFSLSPRKYGCKKASYFYVLLLTKAMRHHNGVVGNKIAAVVGGCKAVELRFYEVLARLQGRQSSAFGGKKQRHFAGFHLLQQHKTKKPLGVPTAHVIAESGHAFGARGAAFKSAKDLNPSQCLL
jgi:hypothetical protein